MERTGRIITSMLCLCGAGALRAHTAALAYQSQPQSSITLRSAEIFPPDNPWNREISDAPVDPNSAALIASIGLDKSLHPDFGAPYHGLPNGIPYIVVSANQPAMPIRFAEYGGESDPGPYPVPLSAPVEGGPAADGDRHVLAVDPVHGKLYEMDGAHPESAGWLANCGAVFDLRSNRLRPAGWTSADAAGLPIFPGLVRYDEVVGRRAILHALRFTVVRSRRAYVYPARHFASSRTDPNLPPMGMRVRLKSSVDLSGYPDSARVILTCLKRFGMIVADNGGDWFLSGAPDDRWDDAELATLKRIKGRDFEVVKMEGMVTR